LPSSPNFERDAATVGFFLSAAGFAGADADADVVTGMDNTVAVKISMIPLCVWCPSRD
jgi:hypothetical protein